jgi:hypothetical protein
MTLLVTFFVFAAVLGAMALGVMVAGRRLQGSCGGVGGGSCACGPEKRARCEREGSTDARPPGAPIEPSSLTRSRQS